MTTVLVVLLLAAFLCGIYFFGLWIVIDVVILAACAASVMMGIWGPIIFVAVVCFIMCFAYFAQLLHIEREKLRKEQGLPVNVQ